MSGNVRQDLRFRLAMLVRSAASPARNYVLGRSPILSLFFAGSPLLMMISSHSQDSQDMTMAGKAMPKWWMMQLVHAQSQ